MKLHSKLIVPLVLVAVSFLAVEPAFAGRVKRAQRAVPGQYLVVLDRSLSAAEGSDDRIITHCETSWEVEARYDGDGQRLFSLNVSQ